MAFEPNASWHPALMPNNGEPGPTSQTQPQPEPEAPSQPDTQMKTAEAAADDGDTWFPGDSGDAWLDSEQPAPAAALEPETQSATQDDAPAAAEAETKTESPVQPSGPTLGHASSVSFARTVSHDVSFHDDDDSELHLSRTDTDPFKFMPPTDRTNSFPPVPPTNPSDDRPLPSTQAEEVIQELDKADHEADNISEKDAFGTKNPPQLDDNYCVDAQQEAQFVGHDESTNDEQQYGSRYEEGVPLIPRASGDSDGENHSQDRAADTPLFGEDNDGGDDFFSQVQDADADGVSPLERKSTIQAMGSVGGPSLSKTDTLQDMAEQTEDEACASASPHVEEEVGMSSIIDESSESKQALPDGTTAPASESVAAKWQEAFAGDDDDDFLPDDAAGDTKEIDPAAFFGSDDEGLLDDDDEPAPASKPVLAPAPSAPSQPQNTQSRYTPQTQGLPAQNSTAPNPYAPQPQALQTPSYSPSHVAAAQFPFAAPHGSEPVPPQLPPGQPAAYGAPPPRPEVSKAQSFADKQKGGYTSPYDLPMDVVKPRKRASMQHLPRTAEASAPRAPPPARSSSMITTAPSPSGPPSTGSSPSLAAPGQGSPSNQLPPPPPAGSKNKESFFEDLPMTSRARPASRQSNRAQSPVKAGENGPPGPPGPPGPLQHSPNQLSHPADSPPAGAQNMSHSNSGDIPNLVPPPRTNPYASLQPQQPPQAPGNLSGNNRYSPAPAGGPGVNGVARPGSANRYSPAPTGSRPASASYSAAPTPPSTLPHLPRTSSPLAHFEASNDRGQAGPAPNGDHVGLDRRGSSNYEPRLNRVPSLPPTREVEEEEEVQSSSVPKVTPTESRCTPSSPPVARQTPPPTAADPSSSTLSPTKQSAARYTPQTRPSSGPPEQTFMPPPRSRTQSPPGSLHGGRTGPQAVPSGQRPASSQGPSPAQAAHQAYVSATRPSHRPRGPSVNFNMVAPTDGREQDPLQRWKGAPIITWGIGGTMVTSFPKSIPRYGMSQTAPTIVRTPGEVRLRSAKDTQPLEERLAKFPGPLKGKAKKKETLAWLTDSIETLEKDLPGQMYQGQLPHDDKRATERILLYKILRAFIEFDGALEGNEQAVKAVRGILAPGLQSEGGGASLYGTNSGPGFQASTTTQMQSDVVDSGAVGDIRTHLLLGDREKAVWSAVDKRLWGHAMLISHTVSPDLYKQVAQEFVRKEVNYSGHSNESLAALYKVLSGNHNECVDELVPSHARAGLQLMNTTSATGSVQNAMNGLDKWRETLSLVLSNRSPEDVRALDAMGNLLSSYGRAEAAHICFLFSRQFTAFGGVDDPASSFVLLGADHRTQAEQFGKETEAVLLSEVFEYGLSLANSHMTAGVPHLAGYKLQHAVTLAEHGYRDKALQYCDAIATSIIAQTKRSPYHHPVLESAVDDLLTRLKQAPRGEESSSWISKPNLNTVSNSMWNSFNKFVAGDDANGSGPGTTTDAGAETGPFARIAGGTPTISPSPSATNLNAYGSGSAGYPAGAAPPAAAPPASTTRTASRYAPMAPQPAASSASYEPASPYAPAPRSSTEGRGSFEAPRSSEESYAGAPGMSYAPATQQYSPVTYKAPEQSPSVRTDAEDSSKPQPPAEVPPSASSFVPYGMPPASAASTGLSFVNANSEHGALDTPQQPSQDYEPPSYGFEPPSLIPNEEPATQETGGSGTTSGYEPPAFQPYGYEPPSYNPDPETTNDDESGQAPKLKKSFMDDDDGDDISALRPQEKEKSKEELDRENQEMFKRVAEEEEKRAAEQQQEQQQAGKKGWGFSGWWGGGKKEASTPDPGQANKPIRAKLGEASSFVYDPDLKRWVNKKGGADQPQAPSATPPPPKTTPRSNAGTPPPPMGGGAAAPPRPPLMPAATSDLSNLSSQQESLSVDPVGAPAMTRSVSNTSIGAGGPPSRPPSRPATSMSNASSIDDLIGAAAPRKPGAKKAKRSGRYVDVMAK